MASTVPKNDLFGIFSLKKLIDIRTSSDSVEHKYELSIKFNNVYCNLPTKGMSYPNHYQMVQ